MPGELLMRPRPVWEITAQRSDENGLTITTFERMSRRYDVVSSANCFVDIAFDRFDLKQVCAIILNENPSFPGHKDALAAALCGWMLGQGEGAVFRRRSVALSIATTLARAERSYAKKPLHEQLTSLRYPHVSGLPPAFFAELYYPIGGLKYIAQTPARYGLRHELTELRNRLYIVNVIAAIDHIHQQLSANGTALMDVSLGRTFELTRSIEAIMHEAKAPNDNNLRYEYVAKFERSLPFLYAASTIPYSRSISLLGAIANANWASILRPGVLRELLSRAAYYATTVYSKNANIPERVGSVEHIVQALAGIEKKSFEPPAHILEHKSLIEHFYSEVGQQLLKDKKRIDFWTSIGRSAPKTKKAAKSGRLQLVQARRTDGVGGVVQGDSKSK